MCLDASAIVLPAASFRFKRTAPVCVRTVIASEVVVVLPTSLPDRIKTDLVPVDRLAWRCVNAHGASHCAVDRKCWRAEKGSDSPKEEGESCRKEIGKQ